MPIQSENLIKILESAKTFSNSDLKKSLNKAEEKNQFLYDYLVENKIIEDIDLKKLITDFYKISYIDLNEVKINKEAFDIIPLVVAQRYKALAFDKDAQGLHVALADPSTEFKDNIIKRADSPVIFYLADEDSLDKILKQNQPSDQEEFQTLLESVDDSNKSHSAKAIPIIKIVQTLLTMGFTNKASDIHVEPFEEDTVIRFRIDGILHDIARIPKNLHELIVARIKILSRLKTDEHRAAQDGKLKFTYGKGKIDVRVSIIPVVHGEKIVMRILAEQASQYNLENLGFREKELKQIIQAIERPWGMILSTGPTGCGKTTTLYSILKRLNTREVNISTIEDPVEYDIDGVNQIQVNAKTGLSFSAGLRSIVRQDPDIIMVGEIRDEETAKIAINAALTGHLVLSTIHTNDSATTLPRLIEMGVQSFLVASTVNIAIAQRLVRKICAKCKYQIPINDQTKTLIEKELSPDLVKKYKMTEPGTVYHFGKGCSACQFTGYKGRMGIYEVLMIDDDIKKMIMNQDNSNIIKQKSIEKGMITMIEDGILKVLDGITSIDELLRVAQE